MNVWVSYDPNAAFPQAAIFGRGVETSKGHIPPTGMSSFSVNSETLAHGIDEEMYQVTAPDVLSAKAQTDRDSIVAVRNIPILIYYTQQKAIGKIGALPHPSYSNKPVARVAAISGTGIDSIAVIAQGLQSARQRRGKPNASDLVPLVDAIDDIHEAMVAIVADIDVGVITDTATIDADSRWPS